MILEAKEASLRFHFKEGETVELTPGQPTLLDDEKASRLFLAVPDKVRLIQNAPSDILPKWPTGSYVQFEHWTDVLAGTVEASWFETRPGLAAGYWYTVRLEDGTAHYAHESHLTALKGSNL